MGALNKLKRRLELPRKLDGLDPPLGDDGGVPAGFSLWTTNGEPWTFNTQNAISQART